MDLAIHRAEKNTPFVQHMQQKYLLTGPKSCDIFDTVTKSHIIEAAMFHHPRQEHWQHSFILLS